MPRTLSAAVSSAIAAKTITLAQFARIAFADNTLYLFNGVGTLTASGPPANPASTFPYGQAFTGLGWLAKISAIPQTTKVQAQNIILTLSGIPSALIAEAIGQVRITGTVTIWYGFFDQSTGALLTDPVQVFSGSIDVPSLSDGGDTSTISLSCENTLLSLNLAPNRRFDDPDQQLYLPGDLGFSFVEQLANMQLFWPAPASFGTPYQTSIVVTPNPCIVGVGTTQQLTLTINNSSGPPAVGNAAVPSGTAKVASSNPLIATVDDNGLVTGVSPGVCLMIERVTTFNGGPPGIPFSLFRAACVVIVTSPVSSTIGSGAYTSRTTFAQTAFNTPSSFTIPPTAAGSTVVMCCGNYLTTAVVPLLNGNAPTFSLGSNSDIFVWESVGAAWTNITFVSSSREPNTAVVYEFAASATVDTSNSGSGIGSGTELSGPVTGSTPNELYICSVTNYSSGGICGYSCTGPWFIDVTVNGRTPGGSPGPGCQAVAFLLNSTGFQQTTFTVTNARAVAMAASTIVLH